MILKYREAEKCALCPSTFLCLGVFWWLFWFCFILVLFILFYCRGLFLLTGDKHRRYTAFANVCGREMLFLLVNFFFGSL